MKIPLHFTYHFYPVGQGLFATGTIYSARGNNPKFLWVYDCGTNSKREFIDTAIADLENVVGNRKRIDLLVLSHFDSDHINGVIKLLNKFKVGILLLPYLTFPERIAALLKGGDGDGESPDPLTPFYINPVVFLSQNGGEVIEKIVFVPASGEKGPAYSGEFPAPENPKDTQDEEPSLDIDEKLEDAGENEEKKFLQAANDEKVKFLKPDSTIAIRSYLWEFIPYNEPTRTLINSNFINTIDALKGTLIKDGDEQNRKKALTELKKVYDKTFGSSAKMRNIISLFLYAGPIAPRWNNLFLSNSNLYEYPLELCIINCKKCLLNYDHNALQHKCSILYSGDGYLNQEDRLRKIITYLNQARIHGIAVFQVMHHGARGNWHPGVAAEIDPLFSVFSSDPDRGHPDQEVYGDFLPYRPIMVNKDADFTVSGIGFPC